ncbi:glycosyltransferase [Thermoflavimicrobium daqui]|uniref:Glycosyltransferase family 4 protein n=1 Tax=Thermoflavimicrobium daqui TaxID=2137476 RepID=A0A364K5P3_9BACL|nr:glycosyltransferase [Thermoflavimicrobium daqui]RAL24579.1 hypothetical protein DL897_09740 [Thermoflavimicrobium daqui]
MSQRVLVISHMYPNPVNPMSGIFVHNELKALKEQGIEVEVLSPIPKFPFYPKWKEYRQVQGKTKIDDISVTYVPTRMFPGGLFFSTYGDRYERALISHVEAIYNEFSFDLIHCHTIYPDGFAGGKMKGRFQVPVVCTIHGSDIMLYPKRSQGVYRKTMEALQMADYIVTVSERLLHEAKKMVPSIHGETIYNGFDPCLFTVQDKIEARRKLELPEQGKILLFVGNLYPVKGIEFLLQAFARICSHDSSLHLCLVGDGPLRSTLEQQVKELNISHSVSFKGRRAYDEIPTWISSSDVVVLSSLSEGLPSILLESMGSARPMIATAVGGIPEILQNGKTGILVEPKDVDGLASAMHKLLIEDSHLANQMGQQAYQSSQSLTWQAHASKMEDLYQRLVNQNTL